MLLEVRVEI